MKSIGLCMIVRNEMMVIRRCLDSIRPLVDYVMIQDTGSTDGTQAVVRAWLSDNDVPGEVFDEPWVDFAYNRTLGLERMRRRANIDYALIMDADDVMQYEPGFAAVRFKAGLTADHCFLPIVLGATRYARAQLCSNRKPYRFRGVLHEYLEVPPGASAPQSPAGVWIAASTEGARSADPDKYRRDATTLEAALAVETNAFLRRRYTFYLAQSRRDAGDLEQALARYEERAAMGGWQQEVYVSLLEAARLRERSAHPEREVLAAYLRAANVVPARAEALHGAARFCRRKSLHDEGYHIARRGIGLTTPSDGLFLEPWIYETGLLDEYAVNAYWSGRPGECLAACERILAVEGLAEPDRKRIIANADFARNRIARQAQRPPTPTPVRPASPVPDRPPVVLMAILAKQKEAVLPFYLACIDALDYPRDAIVLHVRTNNNTDATERILRSWINRVGHAYRAVEFDASDVGEPVQQFGVHEWNTTRFRVLARIRHDSMDAALRHDCDFYFVADVDNFLRPHTLRALVAANLPIVAPLLHHQDQRRLYSNYHESIDERGYFVNSSMYETIWSRRIKGLIEVPVVHCTYLVRRDAIKALSYDDGTERHEYVIFSSSARRAGIAQYLDNRDVYGYLGLDETTSGAVALIGEEVMRAGRAADRVEWRRRAPAVRRQPLFLHASWRTASTWIWSRFRRLPGTLAFFEPFSMYLNSIERGQATSFDHRAWSSGHTPTDPYYLEYAPLIRHSGGVRLFHPAIAYKWFIPDCGLDGDLRAPERRYVSWLLREAERRERVAVLGFCRSLGRIRPLRRTFGGLHVLLRRNLWRQWMSYLRLRDLGERFFYDTVPLLANRTDDRFIAGLATATLRHYGRCADDLGSDTAYQALTHLPEMGMFRLFMGLHLYLYLNAIPAVDVIVDTTRLAEDDVYRSSLEASLSERTGLQVTFDGGHETLTGPAGHDVDWDDIHAVGHAAASALMERRGMTWLPRIAETLIEQARTEMQRQSSYASPRI